MGCILCCNKNTDEEMQTIVSKPVEYSWNQRKTLDPKDFTIENFNDSCTGRLPGTINGEQFIIQNCKKTRIYLLDNIGTITIDDCSECDMIIGPVKTSIFIRDCNKCNIMVACQQFRTRDCRNLTIFLSCTSQPIIESTSKFKVGSYQLYYPKLAEQFHSANLSPFNCNWSDIYDFTPVSDQGSNFAILPEDTKPFDLISPPASVFNANLTGDHGDTSPTENDFINELIKMEITDSRMMSVVPYTFGNRRALFADGSSQVESLVLILFNNDKAHKLSHDFVRYINENSKHVHLIKTRESKLSLETSKTIFGQSITQKDFILQDPIISLEFFGLITVNELVSDFKKVHIPSGDMAHLMYVAPDVATAKVQIDLINNLANMGMNTF